MKAVRIHEHGDLDVLRIEDISIPTLGPEEVRIQIKAAGLNHLDTWVRRGVPGHKYPLPITPGCDGAGIVDELGSAVSGLKKGDRVLLAPGLSCGRCASCASGQDQLCRYYGILGETRDGCCAEFVAVNAKQALPIPGNLSFEDAAAIPLVFLTAWHMLIERAKIRPGETVLIHAAGSGVSSAAIQIAKLWGTRVIATAGSAEKCEKAKKLGADEAINYQKQDFYEEVRKFTGKRGVDVAIDHVGETTLEKSVRCLVKGGRLVTCGTTSGFEIKLDFRHVFFKSLSILGSTMGSRGELHEILGHVASGKLHPVVDSVFPLEKIQQAHTRIGERAVFGKVIVTL